MSDSDAHTDEIRFRRRDGIEARPIPDGEVLVDMSTGRCFELNRVGAEVWEMLAAPASLSGIRAALCARYGVPAEVMSRDVAALLAQLERESLVEPATCARVPAP